MVTRNHFEKEINLATEEDGRYFEVLAHANGVELPGYRHHVTENTRKHFQNLALELRAERFLFKYEEALFLQNTHPMQYALSHMEVPKWPRYAPFDFIAQHNKAFYFALTEASAFESIQSAGYPGIADIRTLRTLLLIRQMRGIPLNDRSQKFRIICMDFASRWGIGYEVDEDTGHRWTLPYRPGWFNTIWFAGEWSPTGDLLILDSQRFSLKRFLQANESEDRLPKLIISTLTIEPSHIDNPVGQEYRWLNIDSAGLLVGTHRSWAHADLYLKRIGKVGARYLWRD